MSSRSTPAPAPAQAQAQVLLTELAAHTEESLRALRLPALWGLYEAATGTAKRTPNKTYLVRKLLKAQAELPAAAPDDPGPTEPEPTPASLPRVTQLDRITGADSWGGAVNVEDRIRHVQRQALVRNLDALRATPELQTTVAKDIDRQRRLLGHIDKLEAAEDIAEVTAAIEELEELRYKRRVIGRPGALRRVKAALGLLTTRLARLQEEAAEAQAEDADATDATGATDATEPVDPDDAWQGKVGIDDRVRLVRAAADLETLDQLEAATPAHPLQSRVIGELAKQRQALKRAEATEGARGPLLALLGNRRTHARPGVVAALKAKLAQVLPDDEELTEDLLTPLADLSVEQLRTVYEREVGRPTGSDDRRYLIWKVRSVRQGRIEAGPSTRRRDPSLAMRAVPLRLPEPVVEQMDVALKAAGFSSRTAFIRAALADRLAELGADEVAQALRAG